MLKRAAWLLVAALTLGAIAAGGLYWKLSSELDRPLNVSPDGTTVVVPPGTPLSRTAAELASNGLLDDPRWLSWYGRLSGDAVRTKAGEYRVLPGTTPRTLLEKFVSGDVYLHSFTIVEGWTFVELLAAMRADPTIEASLHSEDGPRLLETLAADYAHPEGLFLPETYRFPRGSTDVDILRQAHALLNDVLAEEWPERAADVPLDSPYDALILASIIEKETALASERPRIAGVFTRRMQRGMRLQTDPTVIYGLGDTFDGNLTRKHLTTDTPYNTYTRPGCPQPPLPCPAGTRFGRRCIRWRAARFTSSRPGLATAATSFLRPKTSTTPPFASISPDSAPRIDDPGQVHYRRRDRGRRQVHQHRVLVRLLETVVSR